jgi:hypothetical protein
LARQIAVAELEPYAALGISDRLAGIETPRSVIRISLPASAAPLAWRAIFRTVADELYQLAAGRGIGVVRAFRGLSNAVGSTDASEVAEAIEYTAVPFRATAALERRRAR